MRLNVENPELIKEKLINNAHKENIFVRPSWKLLSELPMYLNCQKGNLNVAENQSKRLINLPSSPQLLNPK